MFRIKFSREIILKLLYLIDLTDPDETEISSVIELNFRLFKGVNDSEKEFIKKVINKILEEKNLIDKKISANLIGWKLERLNTIDRNLLRMGIAESSLNPQKAIIIDDIIRIAKKYSEQDSFKIINAILDKVV